MRFTAYDFIDSASSNRTGPCSHGPGDGCGSTGRGWAAVYCSLCVLLPHSEKLPNLLIQELLIRRTSSRPCRVPPQRRNGHQRNVRHEPSLISRVAYRKVQVRLGRHIKKRNLDRPQRPLRVSVESRCTPNVVMLPGPALQDQIVRIRAGNKIRPKLVQHTLKGRSRLGSDAGIEYLHSDRTQPY